MKYLLGNWKMNMSIRQIEEFGCKFSTTGLSNVYVGVAVPSIYYGYCQLLKNNMHIGIQNCSEYDCGAYTGEISAKMLGDALVDFCLVGHSERRHIFHETDEIINKKILKLCQNKVLPVLCVGETLQEYEANKTRDVLSAQLNNGLKDFDWFTDIVIAYEPVWAIGTGKTASVDEIKKTTLFLKEELYNISGKVVPVLYGGSVKPSNTAEILDKGGVDGVLVGGASLDPVEFSEIKNVF